MTKHIGLKTLNKGMALATGTTRLVIEADEGEQSQPTVSATSSGRTKCP